MRTLTVEREISIPKGTSKGSPLRMEVPVGEGLVVETRVTFPPGPAGYVGVRLRIGGVQIVPQRLTEWLVGDDITFSYKVPINLFQSNGRVTAEVYNEDEVYDHSIILTFELLHQEKTPEELLTEIAQTTWDEKLSAVKEAVEAVLSAIVELKGTIQQGFERQLEVFLQRQQEDFYRRLREAPLEELTRI